MARHIRIIVRNPHLVAEDNAATGRTILAAYQLKDDRGRPAVDAAAVTIQPSLTLTNGTTLLLQACGRGDYLPAAGVGNCAVELGAGFFPTSRASAPVTANLTLHLVDSRYEEKQVAVSIWQEIG